MGVLGVAEPSRGVAFAVELRNQSSQKSVDSKTNVSRSQLALFESILIHKRCALEESVKKMLSNSQAKLKVNNRLKEMLEKPPMGFIKTVGP
jgi:hypothetical protein